MPLSSKCFSCLGIIFLELILQFYLLVSAFFCCLPGQNILILRPLSATSDESPLSKVYKFSSLRAVFYYSKANKILGMFFLNFIVSFFFFVIVALLVYLLAPIPEENALYTNSTRLSLPGNLTIKEWMKGLDDDVEVSHLSLPGTHDSGTYNCHFWQLCRSSQCQSWSILKQLESGIRFLDLRIEIFQQQLTIVHGEIKLGKFQQNFADISTFLKNNPSEFVILAFQAQTDSKNNAEAIIQALKRHNIDYVLSTLIPKVRELRGKAWVLRGLGTFLPRTYELNGTYGIQDKNHLYYQDYYEISDEFTIKDKVYEVVKTAFEVSNKNKYNRTRLKVNSLSAAGLSSWIGLFIGPYPYMIALHPMGPNSQLNEQLRKRQKVSLGITIMDFPGNAIIERIVNSNQFVNYLKFRQNNH